MAHLGKIPVLPLIGVMLFFVVAVTPSSSSSSFSSSSPSSLVFSSQSTTRDIGNICVGVSATTTTTTTTSSTSSESGPHSNGNNAARELQRYLYLATGSFPRLLSIHPHGHNDGDNDDKSMGIIVDDCDVLCLLVGAVSTDTTMHRWIDSHEAVKDLNLDTSLSLLSSSSWHKAREFVLQEARKSPDAHALSGFLLAPGNKTTGPTPVVVVHGGNDLSMCYAVFTLLEKLGFAFRLHGEDIVPAGLSMEHINSFAQTIVRFPILLSPAGVAVRGIQPFHDFSEGPDQWNTDDYKMYMEQLQKLKMNFIGLHTYPNREPTVWTGTVDQFDASSGNVSSGGAYQTSYMTTGGGGDWGGRPFNTTSTYIAGAHMLLAGGTATPECYGSDLLDGHGSCLIHASVTDSTDLNAELFNSVAAMLSDAFAFGRTFNGIKTCVGTEAPLAVPATATNATVQELYEGVFQRLAAADIPLDYYWIWTSEGWPARSSPVPMTNEEVTSIVADFLAANAALSKIQENALPGSPQATLLNMSLATCGWTLGPKANRSYFDDVLPAGWTLSSINEAVGNTPPEPEYAQVSHHPKWSIPWMEDDPGLLAPQLWVNRTLEYSAQAVAMGVSGLLGIHWRTREVSPQLAALASYPWQPDLSSSELWESFFAAELCPQSTVLGPPCDVAIAAARILDAADSYNFPRPDTWAGGPGEIVPKCDPSANETYAFVDSFLALRPQVADAAGPAPGAAASALSRFDFWANSLRYLRLMSTVGCSWSKLNSCIAQIPGLNCTQNGAEVGCFRDCEAPSAGGRIMAHTVTINDPNMSRERCASACGAASTSSTNYTFAGVEFGVACFCDVAAPSQKWALPGGCPAPGTCAASPSRSCPCEGNNSQTCGGDCMIEVFPITCGPSSENERKAAAQKCLPARQRLVEDATSLMTALLQTVSTTGTLGSVENLMQHSYSLALLDTATTLENALGGPLPPNASTDNVYHGTERIFVATPRQSLALDEDLHVRASVLSNSIDSTPQLYYRALGDIASEFQRVDMVPRMHGRTVFVATVPAAKLDESGIEYYVQIANSSVVWPSGAPYIPHTVIMLASQNETAGSLDA